MRYPPSNFAVSAVSVILAPCASPVLADSRQRGNALRGIPIRKQFHYHKTASSKAMPFCSFSVAQSSARPHSVPVSRSRARQSLPSVCVSAGLVRCVNNDFLYKLIDDSRRSFPYSHILADNGGGETVNICPVLLAGIHGGLLCFNKLCQFPLPCFILCGQLQKPFLTDWAVDVVLVNPLYFVDTLCNPVDVYADCLRLCCLPFDFVQVKHDDVPVHEHLQEHFSSVGGKVERWYLLPFPSIHARSSSVTRMIICTFRFLLSMSSPFR